MCPVVEYSLRGRVVLKVTAPTRQVTAFSLIELLLTIGIIAALTGILIPTVNRARESAIRMQCASNLRQAGLADRQYAQDYGGWLLMRSIYHGGTPHIMSPPDGGFHSISFAKYAPAGIWFCPDYRSSFRSRSHSWSAQEKADAVKINRIGYAVYGNFWNDVLQKPESASPGWGIHLLVSCDAYKVHHLRPERARMGEWYAHYIAADWHNMPLPFHWRGKIGSNYRIPRPEGGNILMGDGSVQWSQRFVRYFGEQVYTVPDRENYLTLK
jgi:prepilin-type processing-associated H-X9-DG protein